MPVARSKARHPVPGRLHAGWWDRFFDWDPKWAEHYRQTAQRWKGKAWEELTNYDGLELLGWYPVERKFDRPLDPQRALTSLCGRYHCQNTGADQF